MQTTDAQAGVVLPATFAGSAVIVEVLGASEVRIHKVRDPARCNTGSIDLMRVAETSGAFDFWNDPAEDIYGSA